MKWNQNTGLSQVDRKKRNIFVTEFLTGKIMKIQFKTQVN